MKKVILMILFIGILSNYAQTANAVNTSDNVDIQKLVKKQFEEAKKKEKNGLTGLQAFSKDQLKKSNSQFTVWDVLANKYMILFLFSTIVFSFVGVRRVVIKKKDPDVKLKKNIQLMREEKFIRPIDPRLKKIRTNLCLNSRYLNKSESDVSETARKLNIAKSEIVLASRYRNKSLRAN